MSYTIVAQIAPQRSTQYTDITNILAPYELTLSPLEDALFELTPIQLGRQNYLKFDLSTDLTTEMLKELGQLSMTSGFFRYYESLGGQIGPFLQPIEIDFQPTLPRELMMARRYRGKTNERLTHFLCNIARFSSGFTHQPWPTLRIFDPLSGGGTTLLTGLVLGASVAGVEQNKQDVQTTVSFLKQFLQEERISHRFDEANLKKLGKRATFNIGKKKGERTPQMCLLANGETTQSVALVDGFKPHLIVTDLPYGIQHQGKLVELLTQALPVWASMLPKSGALAFSWDSTRFSRAEMIDVVESNSPLKVRNEPPYDLLAHRVDRVIKQRDVIVAQY